ncbi:MAG: sigma-70 family RNA polymerase sigma factor [Planctomycetes bacterium]|nr:sigma-70 family RNA polymerase sigma factor [Planctomycetota bacterium]
MNRPGATSEDYEAFVELLMAHQRRILGFIRSQVRSLDDAEDLMQQTSIVLWRKFDEFDRASDFAAWAFRIARYEVLNHWSKEDVQRRVFSQRTLDQLADMAEAMRPEFDARQSALQECMKHLDGSNRELLEMRYSQSLSPKSIAERIGQSVWAVYRSLQRVHTSLMTCIERRVAGGRS